MEKLITTNLETIGDTQTIKGTEKIINISPEIIDLPTYDYGASQNPLDYDIALRNKPAVVTGLQVKSGLIQRTGGSTGSQSVTGIGFLPKYISTVVCYRNGVIDAQSIGMISSITNTAYQQIDLVGGGANGVNGTGATPAFGHIRTAGGQYIEPHIVSFDSDGFTINWDYISQNADIIYTCFG